MGADTSVRKFVIYLSKIAVFPDMLAFGIVVVFALIQCTSNIKSLMIIIFIYSIFVVLVARDCIEHVSTRYELPFPLLPYHVLSYA